MKHSEAFKRQIVEEVLSGQETVVGQARRYDLERQTIYRWIARYRSDGVTGSRPVRSERDDYEARIAALERKVGQLAMENEFLKKTSERLRRQHAGQRSVISGPVVSASRKGAGS